MIIRLLSVLVAAMLPFAAGAAALVADISKHQIEISSSYSGTTLLLFGAIDWRGGDKNRLNARDHDVIIVIKGPPAPLQVMRKEEVAGIWLNRHKAVAKDTPSFFVLASSRPLTEILMPEEVAEFALGVAYITPRWSVRPPSGQEPSFADAIRRRMVENRFYAERMNAVQILDKTLFRTEVYFPVNVPLGRYSAEVFLVRDGLIVARQSARLSVDKIGLERAIYDFAHTYPAWYGLLAVVLALLSGLVAGAISRRLAR